MPPPWQRVTHTPIRQLADISQFGKSLDDALEQPAGPFTGLQLDVPKDSTFGRPPQSEEREVPKLPSSFLPSIPDPFFLPPPFIPNDYKLREMCKSAVVTLQDKRSEIEADIVAYVNKRMEDMRQLEDQVRGEVEVLWTRYADGHKPETERTPSSSRPRESFDGKKDKEVPFTDLETPSGVTPSVPKISGQHNVHLAQNATSSLLAASISANAFHAPPPKQFDENKLEHIAKTVSREQGVDREVAMSYAFSTMEEAALARGNKKKEEEVAEEVEVEVEEEEKGIDSWIGLERAQAKKRLERLMKRQSEPDKEGTPEKSDPPEEPEAKAKKDDDKAENGELAAAGAGAEKKKGVKFQEPEPEVSAEAEVSENGQDDVDGLAVHNDDEDGECLNLISGTNSRIRLRHGNGHTDHRDDASGAGAATQSTSSAHSDDGGRQLVADVRRRGAEPPRRVAALPGPSIERAASQRVGRRGRLARDLGSCAIRADRHRDAATLSPSGRVPDQDERFGSRGHRCTKPDPRDAGATGIERGGRREESERGRTARQRRPRQREGAGHELRRGPRRRVRKPGRDWYRLRG